MRPVAAAIQLTQGRASPQSPAMPTIASLSWRGYYSHGRMIRIEPALAAAVLLQGVTEYILLGMPRAFSEEVAASLA